MIRMDFGVVLRPRRRRVASLQAAIRLWVAGKSPRQWRSSRKGCGKRHAIRGRISSRGCIGRWRSKSSCWLGAGGSLSQYSTGARQAHLGGGAVGFGSAGWIVSLRRARDLRIG